MYNNFKNGFIPESLKNNKAEADEIIDRLKADPKFCLEFFYGTSKQKCYISQLRFSELCYLAQNYNVVISEDFFSTILYQTLWSEGTWSKLDTYNHRNSFFCLVKGSGPECRIGKIGQRPYHSIDSYANPWQHEACLAFQVCGNVSVGHR